MECIRSSYLGKKLYCELQKVSLTESPGWREHTGAEQGTGWRSQRGGALPPPCPQQPGPDSGLYVLPLWQGGAGAPAQGCT